LEADLRYRSQIGWKRRPWPRNGRGKALVRADGNEDPVRAGKSPGWVRVARIKITAAGTLGVSCWGRYRLALASQRETRRNSQRTGGIVHRIGYRAGDAARAGRSGRRRAHQRIDA
jgi:hypothetical protein